MLMFKYILKIGILLVVSTGILMAAGPGEGIITKKMYGEQIGYCKVNKIIVKYNLSSLMGEAVVNGTYKVIGSSNEDCDLPSTLMVWLKLQNGDHFGYVELDPAVPNYNGGWAYNAAGSPNWNEVVCGFKGTQATNCQSREHAITLWKSGSVTDVKIAW